MPGYTLVPIQKDMTTLKGIVENHKKNRHVRWQQRTILDKEVINQLKQLFSANAPKSMREAHLKLHVLERRDTCKGNHRGH